MPGRIQADGLTDKQRRFVEEYLKDLNATQAAIRAGYSMKTSEQQGSRMLGIVKVAAAVRAGKATLSERTQVPKEWVVGVIVGSLKTAAAENQHAAVACLAELLSRLQGFIVEPPRTMRVIRSYEDLSDAELEVLIGDGDAESKRH